MNIQWYPGHMTKARRAMEADVRAVDMIIELVDARAPMATRNPDIGALGRGKERIIVMNKADLAEDKVTAAWSAAFRREGVECFMMDARSRKNLKKLFALIERACAAKRERDRKRGILNRPVRAMVAGIPNVGKSTLINTIAGKSSAKTGNRPGVTRGNQWIRLNQSVELLDTPGILWPKFEDQNVGAMIAFLGSINEMIVEPTELAAEFIRFLRGRDKAEGLYRRYELCDETVTESGLIAAIAIKRGCLLAGGEPDYAKASGIIMNEYRAGLLGRISLEEPEDYGAENADCGISAKEAASTSENSERGV